MRKMANERQDQHAAALWSSAMHFLTTMVLETPMEEDVLCCLPPLLPPTMEDCYRQQISLLLSERENNKFMASGSKSSTLV